jgi:NADH pyrophosphatase NudC (nudix superfamily)
MTIDPQTAAAAAASVGVGVLMAQAGLQKSALEWRRKRRICPSCGRQLEARVCRCSSR